MIILPTTVTSDMFEVPDDTVALYVTAAGQPVVVRPHDADLLLFDASVKMPSLCQRCGQDHLAHLPNDMRCRLRPRFVYRCQGCGATNAPQPAATTAVDANTHAAACRRVPLPGDRPDGDMWPESAHPRYTAGA